MEAAVLRGGQETQLLQRGRAMFPVTERFDKSLKVTQGHRKRHDSIDRIRVRRCTAESCSTEFDEMANREVELAVAPPAGPPTRPRTKLLHGNYSTARTPPTPSKQTAL